MKKIIIDCGGYKGDSIDVLRNKWGNHAVHVFECNPFLKVDYSKSQDVIFHPEAVWIKYGYTNLYLQEDIEGDGHSLLREKNTIAGIECKTPYAVPCIDFSQWLFDTFKNGEELYLKMNIEGAEYPVLSKMIEDGTINMIKDAIISYHWPRYKNLSNEYEHNRIYNAVKRAIGT